MAPSLDVMAFNQQALDFAGVLLSDIVVSVVCSGMQWYVCGVCLLLQNGGYLKNVLE